MRFVALFTLALLLAAPPAQAREMEDMNTAVLRTIDKVSARRETFDLPVGKTVRFGNGLFIKLRACRKASALDKPEDAAFLQIWERKPDETEARWVFSGWMFSSNPSLSAMDHPVYDVWTIACKNAEVKKNAGFSEEEAPEGEAAGPDAVNADTVEEKPGATEDATPEQPE